MTPFRDVFSALFFVSVGMLFNPSFVLAQPLMVLAALAIVLVVKPAVALAIVVLMRAERGTAATVAVGLAQIGEFSFILATLGQRPPSCRPRASTRWSSPPSSRLPSTRSCSARCGGSRRARRRGGTRAPTPPRRPRLRRRRATSTGR